MEFTSNGGGALQSRKTKGLGDHYRNFFCTIGFLYKRTRFRGKLKKTPYGLGVDGILYQLTVKHSAVHQHSFGFTDISSNLDVDKDRAKTFSISDHFISKKNSTAVVDDQKSGKCKFTLISVRSGKSVSFWCDLEEDGERWVCGLQPFVHGEYDSSRKWRGFFYKTRLLFLEITQSGVRMRKGYFNALVDLPKRNWSKEWNDNMENERDDKGRTLQKMKRQKKLFFDFFNFVQDISVGLFRRRNAPFFKRLQENQHDHCTKIWFEELVCSDQPSCLATHIDPNFATKNAKNEDSLHKNSRFSFSIGTVHFEVLGPSHKRYKVVGWKSRAALSALSMAGPKASVSSSIPFFTVLDLPAVGVRVMCMATPNILYIREAVSLSKTNSVKNYKNSSYETVSLRSRNSWKMRATQECLQEINQFKELCAEVWEMERTFPSVVVVSGTLMKVLNNGRSKGKFVIFGLEHLLGSAAEPLSDDSNGKKSATHYASKIIVLLPDYPPKIVRGSIGHKFAHCDPFWDSRCMMMHGVEDKVGTTGREGDAKRNIYASRLCGSDVHGIAVVRVQDDVQKKSKVLNQEFSINMEYLVNHLMELNFECGHPFCKYLHHLGMGNNFLGYIYAYIMESQHVRMTHKKRARNTLLRLIRTEMVALSIKRLFRHFAYNKTLGRVKEHAVISIEEYFQEDQFDKTLAQFLNLTFGIKSEEFWKVEVFTELSVTYPSIDMERYVGFDRNFAHDLPPCDILQSFLARIHVTPSRNIYNKLGEHILVSDVRAQEQQAIAKPSWACQAIIRKRLEIRFDIHGVPSSRASVSDQADFYSDRLIHIGDHVDALVHIFDADFDAIPIYTRYKVLRAVYLAACGNFSACYSLLHDIHESYPGTPMLHLLMTINFQSLGSNVATSVKIQTMKYFQILVEKILLNDGVWGIFNGPGSIVWNHSDLHLFRASNRSSGESTRSEGSKLAKTNTVCYCWGMVNGLGNDEKEKMQDALNGSVDKTANIYTEIEKRMGPDAFRPIRIPSALNVPIQLSSISCGPRHAVLISSIGNVYSFGDGGAGRLGHGDENSHAEPKLIESLSSENSIVQMSTCGRNHTIVVTTRGIAFGFGWGERGRLGLGDVGAVLNPTMILVNSALKSSTPFAIVGAAAGQEHSLLLDQHGHVFSCGSGEFGQLGHFDPNNEVEEPFREFPERVVQELMGIEVVQISAGDIHSAALSSLGTLYTWGFDLSGALGRCHAPAFPSPVGGLPLGGIVQVSCSGMLTFVRTLDGKVYLWGDINSSTVRGTPIHTPVKITLPNFATDVSAAPTFGLIVDSEGKLYRYDDTETLTEIDLGSSVSAESGASAARVFDVAAGSFSFLFSINHDRAVPLNRRVKKKDGEEETNSRGLKSLSTRNHHIMG